MARSEFSLTGQKVFVAGHRGMVGSAIVRRLQREECAILTASRDELDLRRQTDVEGWMERYRPDAVFVAAAKVGGIMANDAYPADFIVDNLSIQTNLIQTAWRIGVRKLLFLGSSCIYPREAEQPIREAALLTGPLEPTNQWYAIAKIAGIKMCQAYRQQYQCDFISAMPTNLYGPGDNFDALSSHVLPALLRKIHLAKKTGAAAVTIWGTGKPRREFLHVDDLAEALIYMMYHYSGEEHLNVGYGDDITILDLAQLIAEIIGYRGKFDFDASKPDGTPRKLMDSNNLRSLGWQPRIGLREGIDRTYHWFTDNFAAAP
jgi:GDP-L-fucose synthase